MSGIIRATEIDVSKITFDKIKKRGEIGAKGVRMTLLGKPLIIQISNTRIPFGLNNFENEKTGETKYSLELSLDESDPNIKAFKIILDEIDRKIVTHVSENSEDWWGRKVSEQSINEAQTYKSMVKPDKKGESPPRFRVKLPFYKDTPGFSVYNKGDKVPIEICKMQDNTKDTKDTKNTKNTKDAKDAKEDTKGDTDTKGNKDTNKGDKSLVKTVPVMNWDWAQNGMEITTICECEGLWVVGTNVYCTWRALQIKINKASSRIADNAFLDDLDSESKPAPKPKSSGAGSINSEGEEVVEDSENSENGEEDEYIDDAE